MPLSEHIPNDIRGTSTYRFITLETEIANIQYLLTFRISRKRRNNGFSLCLLPPRRSCARSTPCFLLCSRERETANQS